jgi:hypothetical protein
MPEGTDHPINVMLTGATESPITFWSFVADLIHNLIWPLFAAVAIWWLYPRFVRDILPRLVKVNAFGVEAELMDKLADAITGKQLPLNFTSQSHLANRLSAVQQVLEKAQILWVDGHPNNNTSETEILEQLGAAVTTVTTSGDALSQLDKKSYDLVLSNMSREGNPTEGQQFATGVTTAPVIIYCSKDSNEYGVPARTFGLTNRPDELFHLILDALERRRFR